jgi:hypothetical protein
MSLLGQCIRIRSKIDFVFDEALFPEGSVTCFQLSNPSVLS